MSPEDVQQNIGMSLAVWFEQQNNSVASRVHCLLSLPVTMRFLPDHSSIHNLHSPSRLAFPIE